jgi:hypothetical protein
MVMSILVLRTHSSEVSTGIPQGFPQEGKQNRRKIDWAGVRAGVNFISYPMESKRCAS